MVFQFTPTHGLISETNALFLIPNSLQTAGHSQYIVFWHLLPPSHPHIALSQELIDPLRRAHGEGLGGCVCFCLLKLTLKLTRMDSCYGANAS